MQRFTPTQTHCLLPLRLKATPPGTVRVGANRGAGKVSRCLLLNRIFNQVNALPTQKIKMNKNKYTGPTKATNTKFSYKPFL